ncbi:serine/threonine-protein phosphatase 6 regulatory ankyrin repeat subunit A-like [Ipomoea triloba]|uniref:serine/threonine-protein phosphatase 6 regulatory ankyrin repeat subunit A-like n=1 Tax=Ipomoea triloba TaxID=35885 RepID=UPI00125E97BB|nr:serine/threonine-protein phosphatase 6 regulatory ankyrin repeat subunit A-like [Ipomoea triloba]
MDPSMYKAAVKGKAEDWFILQQKAWEFKSNVTPKGNTVLHIAARHGHTYLVQKILEVCDDALLCAQNKKNETALHIAAKEGHTHVVSALIRYAKTRPELESGIAVREMLRMSNSDGDTALHMAALGGHRGVVKQRGVVKELATEDDEFEFPGNKMGETPLYLAALLNFHDCLSDMLNIGRKPAYGGPLGRTALHAAVISKSTDCVKALLAKESGLGEVGDIYGWTPLHYAAKFCDDEGIIVGEIVGVKSSLAYLPAPCKDHSGWTTAFHIAAATGGIKAMEAILKQCPDAWDMVDSKGRNALHEAVANNRKDVTDYILLNMDHLIDEKDDDGNTPLQYAAGATNNNYNYYERWYGLGFHLHPRAEPLFRLGFSKLLTTPWEEESSVIKNGSRGVVHQKRKKAAADDANAIIGGMAKSAKSEIIVAALIATVTFAAALTVPSGYDDDNGPGSGGGGGSGMAVLRRKAGFWTFVIADTVAFACAFAALCGYVLLLQSRALGWWRWIPILMHNACGVAVVVAFVSGLYTVLVPSTTLKSVGLCVCICVCIIGFTRFFSHYMDNIAKEEDQRSNGRSFRGRFALMFSCFTLYP